MKIGYGRVSKLDQNPQMQIDALKAAGCEKLFIEKISSGKKDRPQWVAANAYLRQGDTIATPYEEDAARRRTRGIVATTRWSPLNDEHGAITLTQCHRALEKLVDHLLEELAAHEATAYAISRFCVESWARGDPGVLVLCMTAEICTKPDDGTRALEETVARPLMALVASGVSLWSGNGGPNRALVTYLRDHIIDVPQHEPASDAPAPEWTDRVDLIFLVRG